MEEKNKLRYERKFLLDNFTINNLGDLRNFLPINFNVHYQRRQINSIYFDTSNYRLFEESLNGMSNKIKIRIRYYGLLEKLMYPKLEIKKKSGLMGEKYLFNLDSKILIENDFSLANVKINNINFNDMNFIKILEPKVIISYTRDYFISSCNRYRLTLDRNINFKYFGQNDIKTNFLNELYYCFNKTILELKYSRSDENIAHKITRGLPARLTSNSKYLLALKHLGLIY